MVEHSPKSLASEEKVTTQFGLTGVIQRFATSVVKTSVFFRAQRMGDSMSRAKNNIGLKKKREKNSVPI